MLDQGSRTAKVGGPEWGQNFKQCLELLRGPGDERRFVGLLLVTRLLPHGSDDAVRGVLDALGTQFLHRLLLPLQRPPAQTSELLLPDVTEHQATCCSLGLAILAAACRLQDFASGPDMRELLPVLVKVIRCGGVTDILKPGVASEADGTADAAAVSDAMECLVGAAAAAPEQTCSTLEHLPVMEALAEWLTVAAAALTSTQPIQFHNGGSNSNTPEGPWHRGVLLAAGLLERLLADGGCGGGGVRATLTLAEHPGAAARVIAALSALVGNARLLLSASTTAHVSSSAPLKPMQQQQQQPKGADGKQAVTGQLLQPDAGAAASAGGNNGGGGAAQLQLEALHLLLLMLRACQEPAVKVVIQELVRLDEQVAWSAAVRRGLGWLLRSRAPGTLKHSALDVAALVVEVSGESWLLGVRAEAAAASTVSSPAMQEQAGSFAVLLIETLKIETGLLLQDALYPDRPVPAPDGNRTSALGDTPRPAPSQRLLDELAARAAQRKVVEEGAIQAAAAAAVGGVASPQTLEEVAASTALATDIEVDGVAHTGPSSPMQRNVTTASTAGPGTKVSAGHRALVLLPTCFRLVECCVEALAADAEAVDCHMDEDMSEIEAGRTHGSSIPLSKQPMLSDAMLQKLMCGLDDIAETLLQFFEAVHDEQKQQKQQQNQTLPPMGPPVVMTSAPIPLLLGAARVLGRYLAEAPGAVRCGRVLRTLPRVMSVRSRAGGNGGGCVTGEEAMEDFALTFLLPGLLQATGPGADGRSEVVQALRSSPMALSACTTFLAHCVRASAAAAPHVERLLVTAADGAGGDDRAAVVTALVRSEQGMADVSMLLLNLLEPSVLGALAAGGVGGSASAAIAAGSSVDVTEAWEVLRHCNLGGGGDGNTEAMAAAAEASAFQHLPPLLEQLLPVLWMVRCWVVARVGVVRALSFIHPLHVPSPVVDLLFRAQLGTRALLCTCCLAAVLLATIMDRLGAEARGGTASAITAVLLPLEVVEAVGMAALSAAAAGTSLQMTQLYHSTGPLVAVGATSEATLPEPLPLTAMGLVEDFAGDGELCWERLCITCGELLRLSTAVRRLAVAGAAGAGSLGWLWHLTEARARGDSAAQELLSEVNLAMLVQVAVQLAAGSA